MAKKKKTVSSTRKKLEESEKTQEIVKEKKRGLFGRVKEQKSTAEIKSTEQKSGKEPQPAKEQKSTAEIKSTEQKSGKEPDSAKEQKAAKKAKPPKEKKPKKTLSPEKRQKIRGGILIAIGLFALIFIGTFLFTKIFRPQSLAELVPGEESIAVLEINVDARHSQVKQFFETMAAYPVYGSDGIKNIVDVFSPFEMNESFDEWKGRKAGIVLMKEEKDGEKNIVPVFFIETADKNKTIKYLEDLAAAQSGDKLMKKPYSGHEIYSYQVGQSFIYTFLNSYLVYTGNEDTIKLLIDNRSNDRPRLSDSVNYRKVANNLAPDGLVFGYVDLHRMFDYLSSSPVFIAQKGQDYLAMRPFIDIFKAEGISVFVEKNHFKAQVFTSLDLDKLGGENYIVYSEKYQGILLPYIKESPVFVAAGHDLTKELGRLEEIFNSGTKASSAIFYGLIEAQKEQYFGSSISLYEDIYPLLRGEYLLTVDKSFEKPEITVVLELPDSGNNALKIEKLAQAFTDTSGVFSPKIISVTLPDGTIGKEIVASPEVVTKSEENYGGKVIHALKIGDSGQAVYYTVIGEEAVFSTSVERIKTVISKGAEDENFTSTSMYKNIIRPVLKSADQFYFIETGVLSESLISDETSMIKPYFTPFGGMAAAKNFFTDGISTVYILELI